jgi:glycosyltransferase involved in cell wall biosynthesis
VFIFRILNMFTISLSMFLHASWLLRRKDVVLVATNPPVSPFLIALACRLRRAKCVLLVQDVYPETLVAAGMLDPSSLVTRAVNRLSKRLYLAMERVCVLGRDMKTLVEKKLQRDSEQRVVIVPNWADVEVISPSARCDNALLRETNLRHKFVVQYAGNMGPVHGIECLVEAAKILNLKNENVHFLFIGSGAKKRWLEDTVRAHNLKNVTVLNSRPRNDQQEFLNACDVAITALVPGMAGVAVPSRMYNILAAGRPLIAAVDPNSEVALVIKEESVGWVVSPGDAQQIVDAIIEAVSNPALLDEMGWRARSVAENKYSFERIIERYRSVVHSVMSDTPTACYRSLVRKSPAGQHMHPRK